MNLSEVLKFELIDDGKSYEVSRGSKKSDDVAGILEIPANHNEKEVTRLANKSFYMCQKLTSVTIPGSIKTIGKDSFASCGALEKITISNGLKEIGDFAFRYCTKLTTIVIPDSVETIGASAFVGCTELVNVTLPKNVKIGAGAFSKCKFKL
jgi:hypothetical protein